ncbi:Por secretion system C-terminal sorting domain-containing protein [Fibrobacter sp. UWB16]|uniref:T9SS type A sorting domain-containing protein n=1 Tax=Fibrobacter sp. UWB16 TaxID=1945874 RepID=UPI000BDDB777|nr:T9SS type A sorting domain-containing protein [Fibrobacter sp. UWB16]SOD12733.1 Por secretion system C-terminal sorting domain-containing protein [Fibrobacter sp. UWB16]
MNYLTRLLLGLGLTIPMAVWAQPAGPAKKYLNLYYKDNALYLGQYNQNCKTGNSTNYGTCVKSEEIKAALPVRGAFYNVINGKWVAASANASQYQATDLYLLTDIDFGQTLGVDGKCSENHAFLPFSGLTFDGKNKTISNLCRVDKGTMRKASSQSPAGVGLFGDISGKIVKNLKISNVHFIVSDKYANGNPASTDAGDYHAVGALAYQISKSEVYNIQLKNIVIQAPLAGGLAGYIENSTVSGVSTIDDSFIQISNERQIETGYIGSSVTVSGVNFSVFSPYKVLLGGLAGAAFFVDIENVGIAVQVENKAAVNQSSLGGLVGLYVYAPTKQTFSGTNPKNSEIKNIKIHEASSENKLVVSGGVAMGGVFGATKRYEIYASKVYGLEVDKIAVTGLNIAQSMALVDDATVAKPMYFGGVIGNANICNGGILKITETEVKNLNIIESLSENGAFQYYMGGIAGFAACENVNNSGNRDDLFLTLTASKAHGKIVLQGGSSEEDTKPKARASAVIGGLVGNAIVSLEENSTAGDSSEVTINYIAKRASGLTDADSVIVGGVFGAVSKFNRNTINKVRLSGLSYKSSIYIEDDGITARAGGIVGEYPLILSGEPKIDFENVHVDFLGGSVVSYKGENVASENTSSSIGGLCGICRTPELISRSSVRGSFTGTYAVSTPPQKDFYVGGLVGEANVRAPAEMIVKNNYHIGTIADKFNGEKGHAGYLFGYMYGNGLGNEPIMISNYHYGADTIGAIGYFDDYGTFRDIKYFNEKGFNKFVAKNNVRDGFEEDLQSGANGSVKNGIVTMNYMQSQSFADFLNSAWTDTGDQVWVYKNDFPTLVDPGDVGNSSSSSGNTSSSSSSANNGVSSSSNEESSSSFENSSSSEYGSSSSSNVTSSSSWGESSSSSWNGGESSSSVGNSSSSSSAGNGNSSSSSSANNGTSSSSNEGSSSSIANSSSSEYGSSSSSDIASSSSSRNDYSSSSINGKSSSSSSETIKSSSSSSVKSSSSKGSRSSSSNYIYEIAEPTAKQDGNALRMTLVDATTAGKFEKVDYHIQVVSETGVYLDTVVNGKSVENVKNGTWRLDPSPVGEYTVTFTLTDGVDSVSYDKKFVTEKEKTYIPHAWQTLSLYALCQNDGDDCVNQVEKLFARHRDGDNSVATTSVYWWDESNPVGDFWQYRKFSVKDKFDSTRGYWYGSVDNEPLVMSLQTPDTNDAIVWKLENKYSGWNLVANPYGWYVKLPKEKKLRFCQWNAESSDYEEPDVLGPYEAIWVHTEKPMTYRIPLKAAIVLEEEKKALSKSADSENWNLRVVLSDNNGKRDSWNELAAGKAASSLGEPPAGMGDRVNLSIVDGKKRLAKSVKQNADDLEWDLEVSATSTRDGHLNFEGLESVWAKGLRVYATVDNETVEVVKDSPVDVKLASKAKNVSVRVTKSAVAANVAKNLLKGLHVGQMSNVLNVGFDAASKLAGANVKVSVVGIDGRIVATDRAIAREGSNAISMKKPKQGVYFVKVKVGSLSAVTRVMVR